MSWPQSKLQKPSHAPAKDPSRPGLDLNDHAVPLPKHLQPRKSHIFTVAPAAEHFRGSAGRSISVQGHRSLDTAAPLPLPNGEHDAPWLASLSRVGPKVHALSKSRTTETWLPALAHTRPLTIQQPPPQPQPQPQKSLPSQVATERADQAVSAPAPHSTLAPNPAPVPAPVKIADSRCTSPFGPDQPSLPAQLNFETELKLASILVDGHCSQSDQDLLNRYFSHTSGPRPLAPLPDAKRIIHASVQYAMRAQAQADTASSEDESSESEVCEGRRDDVGGNEHNVADEQQLEGFVATETDSSNSDQTPSLYCITADKDQATDSSQSQNEVEATVSPVEHNHPAQEASRKQQSVARLVDHIEKESGTKIRTHSPQPPGYPRNVPVPTAPQGSPIDGKQPPETCLHDPPQRPAGPSELLLRISEHVPLCFYTNVFKEIQAIGFHVLNMQRDKRHLAVTLRRCEGVCSVFEQPRRLSEHLHKLLINLCHVHFKNTAVMLEPITEALASDLFQASSVQLEVGETHVRDENTEYRIPRRNIVIERQLNCPHPLSRETQSQTFVIAARFRLAVDLLRKLFPVKESPLLTTQHPTKPSDRFPVVGTRLLGIKMVRALDRHLAATLTPFATGTWDSVASLEALMDPGNLEPPEQSSWIVLALHRADGYAFAERIANELLPKPLNKPPNNCEQYHDRVSRLRQQLSVVFSQNPEAAFAHVNAFFHDRDLRIECLGSADIYTPRLAALGWLAYATTPPLLISSFVIVPQSLAGCIGSILARTAACGLVVSTLTTVHVQQDTASRLRKIAAKYRSDCPTNGTLHFAQEPAAGMSVVLGVVHSDAVRLLLDCLCGETSTSFCGVYLPWTYELASLQLKILFPEGMDIELSACSQDPFTLRQIIAPSVQLGIAAVPTNELTAPAAIERGAHGSDRRICVVVACEFPMMADNYSLWGKTLEELCGNAPSISKPHRHTRSADRSRPMNMAKLKLTKLSQSVVERLADVVDKQVLDWLKAGPCMVAVVEGSRTATESIDELLRGLGALSKAVICLADEIASELDPLLQ
ncbi:uncharacterized protein BJ171DRAFT_505529 [Polychytrium aggregatum]|uniref:uncharacterized protein n=1 Tax=Polychytrium aggregatum TaxID=110093 RepID=UPI0022FE7AA2|nr:uncharacterized protein BJ171DRAFT_505529 [Polychytrium aggregatum]KAI9204342.1 hypothetical protein BJ171DRAFT_505529 [Polychytrium aggregatum]